MFLYGHDQYLAIHIVWIWKSNWGIKALSKHLRRNIEVPSAKFITFFPTLNSKNVANKRIVNRLFCSSYEECPELYSNLKITKNLCNTKIYFTWKISNTTLLHSDAFWPFLFHWGLEKPLLKIHGVLMKWKMLPKKKLAFKGTFRLIPYLHKKWILSTMNLPVQDLIRQKWFFGKCKNWSFQFQK